jgi:hypothetical protein
MSGNMERERTIQIGPVCKFGPGGEYTEIWPDGSELIEFANEEGQPKNTLGRLLNMIAGMAKILRGSQDKQYIEISGPVEITTYEGKNRCAAYTEAGSTIESNRRVCVQRWLFADDWRAGADCGRKPDNHIRAHRAVAKKGVHLGPGGQSTLFDADLKGAKTA